MKRKSIFSLTSYIAIAFLLVFDYRPIRAASLTTNQPTDLNVYAAVSLSNALQEVEQLYEQSRPNVTFSNKFDASGTLAQQILGGSPADVFFSASPTAINALQAANLLLPGTRQNVLSNRLALIEPINSTLSLSSVQDLTSPQVANVAIGDPSIVPAGVYAEELLNNFGLFQQIQPKLSFGTNVRAVLNLVATSQADAGIVYITDALIQPNQVKVANIPPTNAYSPIIYPAAALQGSANRGVAADAADFTNFLSSGPAISVFEQFGFTPAATSVPEPNSAIGILALGALGVGLGLKRKKTQKHASIDLLQKSVRQSD